MTLEQRIFIPQSDLNRYQNGMLKYHKPLEVRLASLKSRSSLFSNMTGSVTSDDKKTAEGG